jgi:XTP/dITP diphosphohydrolase
MKSKRAGRFAIAYCFYAKIGSETSDFDMADVCNEICDKFIVIHIFTAML